MNGDLTYHSSIERLAADEERFVLLGMHQTLVERGLCLREHTHTGALLIFPSYYRRERPELVEHPAVLQVGAHLGVEERQAVARRVAEVQHLAEVQQVVVRQVVGNRAVAAKLWNRLFVQPS